VKPLGTAATRGLQGKSLDGVPGLTDSVAGTAAKKTTWKEFLSRRWELAVAADFFSVGVWTRRGLQRFLVLFFIDLATRRVEIAGIASAANGLWMSQIGRNLTMPSMEF
jgi:hypothetical protein